jgi:hypothetical protein
MALRLLSFLKWPVALLGLAGLFALAYMVNDAMRRERLAEADGDKVDVPKRAANGVIKLGAELAESHSIKDEPARSTVWLPRVAVYGRVVPNPQATVEVRSPFAGTLREDPDASWPALGRRVKAGQVLGRVDIRVGPQERLDLQNRLTEATVKHRGAEDVLKLQQDRVNRLRKASGSDMIVSQRELDEALVALAEARTQMATAGAAVELWQKAVEAINRRGDRPEAAWSEPLVAPADGEVTELTGRPGMAAEAGGLIARLVDFRRPLVRLDFPTETLASGPPTTVEVYAVPAAPPDLGDGLNQLGSTARAAPSIVPTLIGPAPQVEVSSQLTGYWYEGITTPAARTGTRPQGNGADGAVWRPGLFVQAYLPTSAAKPQEAVSVLRTAVLFHQGRPLVYVRIAPGRFERREARILGREAERWVLAAGIAAGEPVVYNQAQVLLSEEFRGDVDND